MKLNRGDELTAVRDRDQLVNTVERLAAKEPDSSVQLMNKRRKQLKVMVEKLDFNSSDVNTTVTFLFV